MLPATLFSHHIHAYTPANLQLRARALTGEYVDNTDKSLITTKGWQGKVSMQRGRGEGKQEGREGARASDLYGDLVPGDG